MARVGFEPATLRKQGTEPTTEPPYPTKQIKCWQNNHSYKIMSDSNVCMYIICPQTEFSSVLDEDLIYPLIKVKILKQVKTAPYSCCAGTQTLLMGDL